jgi:hypothetical protein
MTRLALDFLASLAVLVLFVAACVACQADAAPPVASTPADAKLNAPTVERNLICERVALENPKLQCTPELTDAGELHTHTARLLIDGQHVVCAVNSSQVSAVCGPMFVAPQQHQQPQPAKKPAPKAKAK